MSDSLTLQLCDAAATEALGARLLAGRPGGAVVYLEGDLGAGKTTLARGLLRAMGHAGHVRSPSYTLMEPYATPAGALLHLDLYRLSDAQELDFLGLEDVDFASTLVLVEWPEQGLGRLPPADLRVALALAGEGRRARLSAHSPSGEAWLAAMQHEVNEQ